MAKKFAGWSIALIAMLVVMALWAIGAPAAQAQTATPATPAATSVFTDTVTVPTKVNIRTGAGTTYPVVPASNRTASGVYELAGEAITTAGYTWYPILLKDGKTVGYVAKLAGVVLGSSQPMSPLATPQANTVVASPTKAATAAEVEEEPTATPQVAAVTEVPAATATMLPIVETAQPPFTGLTKKEFERIAAIQPPEEAVKQYVAAWDAAAAAGVSTFAQQGKGCQPLPPNTAVGGTRNPEVEAEKINFVFHFLPNGGEFCTEYGFQAMVLTP